MKVRRALHRALRLPSLAKWESSRRPLFSFIQNTPSPEVVSQADALVGIGDPSIVSSYEEAFAALVGEGECVSFAAGRMAFHALLTALNVKEGDEVILPGFTCSVMVNAVLRSGATPIFCDVEQRSLGSDPKSISRCLSPRTRVIVAQHSFGYPCDVVSIMGLVADRRIAVVEDCATTFDTHIDGVAVGNFGHAAIFSTDHTKPINTLVGGMVYTRDLELAVRVRRIADRAGELPHAKQRQIHTRLALESRLRSPDDQWRLGVRDVLAGPVAQVLHSVTPYLDEDYMPHPGKRTYPYPARLPAFLALVGMDALVRWPVVRQQRRASLGLLRQVLAGSALGSPFPDVLDDPRIDVAPLRLAWIDSDAERIRLGIRKFVAVEGTWFLGPIVATSASAESFGYRALSCTEAEYASPRMVNIPILDEALDAGRLAEMLSHAFSIDGQPFDRR
jgi:hypothetical protein